MLGSSIKRTILQLSRMTLVLAMSLEVERVFSSTRNDGNRPAQPFEDVIEAVECMK